MLRNFLLPLLAVLLSLTAPAYGQTVDTLHFAARPNIELAAGIKPNLDHYRVVLYKDANKCAQYLDPTLNLAVYMVDDKLSDTVVTLDPNSIYAIGTYMRINDGQWDLNAGSCRVLNNADAVRTPYAPSITRVPNSSWFATQLTVILPQTQPGYRLVKVKEASCAPQYKRRTEDDDRVLDQALVQYEERLLAGTYSYGVYAVSDSLVLYAHRPSLDYKLVPGSCQTVVVNDFLKTATYQPQLPEEIRADYVAPEVHGPTWIVSGNVVASYEGDFSGGGLLRGEYLGIHPLVLTAAIGADFPSLHAGSNRFAPGFELGAGYAHSSELNSDLLLDWNVTGNVGLGSVLTHCGPTTFDATQAYTCGHHEEGFPVLLSAPWIGPGAAIRVLSAVNAKDKPAQWLSFGLGGSLQIYALLDGDRQVAVQTTEGEEKISYRFGETTTWFKPVAVFEIGYAW